MNALLPCPFLHARRILLPVASLILLGFAPIARSQPAYIREFFASHGHTVVEGRSITLYAEPAAGAVQWQVRAAGNLPWVNVTDDAIYRAAATPALEIINATAALGGNTYRYIVTAGGQSTASDPIKLTVLALALPRPVGLAMQANGDLVVSDAANHTVQTISNARMFGWLNEVTCTLSGLAGTSGLAGAGDGTGAQAAFNQPDGLSLTPAGDLVVADTANGLIRRIDPATRTVTTLAGSSTARGNIDGAGLAARFAAPTGVGRDHDGSFYIADFTNHTIRKLSADGTVSTFAGSPGQAGSSDGKGAAARFHHPTGIAVASDGTVYVGDTGNNLIRKIKPDGEVSTLAGVAGIAGASDGAGEQATFNGPTGLAVPANSSAVFVADTGNSTIRRIDGNGNVITFAGVPTVAGLKDIANGDFSTALFNQPRAIAYDESPMPAIFVADTGNAVIRVLALYDGATATLPLQIAAVPLPVTAPPVVTPPTPSGANGQSPGGGGAISAWFLAAIVGAWALHKRI